MLICTWAHFISRRNFAPLLLLTALPCAGQFLSVGIKAGVPLTGAYSTVMTGHLSAITYDRRYIIGPTAEIHFPFHISLEVDALYRRNGFTNYASGGDFSLPPASRNAINDWQLPFLAKYEKKFPLVRPFVDAGVVYRHVSGSNVSLSLPRNSANTTGFAIGAGASAKLLLIRLSPEIRYTHWFTPPFNNGDLVVSSTTNQADFLLGITF